MIQPGGTMGIGVECPSWSKHVPFPAHSEPTTVPRSDYDTAVTDTAIIVDEWWPGEAMGARYPIIEAEVTAFDRAEKYDDEPSDNPDLGAAFLDYTTTADYCQRVATAYTGTIYRSPANGRIIGGKSNSFNAGSVPAGVGHSPEFLYQGVPTDPRPELIDLWIVPEPVDKTPVTDET